MLGDTRRELADVTAGLADTFRTPLVGSPVIVVAGPRGGGTKTTTAAGLLHHLGQHERVAGMLMGVDANPDTGDLAEALGVLASQVPHRLADFLQAPDNVRHPADWQPLLDVVGRVHLLHNQQVPAARIADVGLDAWRDGLVAVRRFAQITVIDTGTSVVHPAAMAALEQAGHLVIATRADPRAINSTVQAIGEVVAAGFGDLVRRSTVALTVVDKNAKPSSYDKGAEFFRQRVGQVVVVPYDRAAGAVGPIQWDKLRAESRLASLRILAAAMADLRERFAPAGLVAGPGIAGADQWPQTDPGHQNPTEGAPLTLADAAMSSPVADPDVPAVPNAVAAESPVALPSWARQDPR